MPVHTTTTGTSSHSISRNSFNSKKNGVQYRYHCTKAYKCDSDPSFTLVSPIIYDSDRGVMSACCKYNNYEYRISDRHDSLIVNVNDELSLSQLASLCLAYTSRLKPTKVFVWQYNNKRQSLSYRVHYATKVFDACTLCAVIGYLLQQTLTSRAHYTTFVWPIQFLNRSDVCWVGLDNNILVNVLASLSTLHNFWA